VTTGTITVTSPSSGVSYSFDNGTTFQASNVKSGLAASTTYQVVVKDNVSACLSTATATVIDPILAVPTAPTTSVTQPTCSTPTGTITVTSPSSGVSYSFDNGATFQTSNVKSGLAAATTYQVIVKDNVSNCISIATPSVIDPTTSVTQPTCSVATGTITVTNPASGVTYSFDNGTTFQVGATSNALASGTYSIIVKDDVSNCLSTATAAVIDIQPTTPVIGSVSKTNPTIVTCPALNDGTITVTATGSNVEYSKDNGVNWQLSHVFTALTANSYTIKVRNSVSTCVATYTPNPVVLTALSCPANCVVPKPSIVNH
jgi:large repetitive protein